MRHRWPLPAARHRARPPEERSLTEPGPRLLGSFPRADVALAEPLPEVAFLGRSNVGKSTLLNALAGRRIARVSATPGKTRMLNVYEVRGAWCVGDGGASRQSGSHREQPRTTHHALYLLDLPGYGYARASRAERAGFQRLMEGVLGRERLRGVVWLLDIRRDPSTDDLAMQDAFAAAGTPVLAALTKSDQLPRGQRVMRANALRATLGLPDEQVITTSARKGEGIEELREAVAALVGAEGA